MSFIDTIQYGEAWDNNSRWAIDEVMNFITFLARQGIPEWDTQARDELENDIAMLFSGDDTEFESESSCFFSSLNEQKHNITPAILTYSQSQPEVLLCKSWMSKKWHKTKRFVRKHKKTIIIASVVVVATTAIIIATGGAATPPAVASAAAAAAAADKPRVNKPGEVQLQNEQEEPIPLHESLPLSSIPISEPSTPILSVVEKQALAETLREQSNVIKETLSEELPSEPLNILPDEHPIFWDKASEKAKTKGANFFHGVTELATDITKTISYSGGLAGALINTHEDSVHEAFVHAHENIDKAFGTNLAYPYTQQGKEEIAQVYNKLGINLASDSDAIIDIKGKLPPGSLIGSAAKNLPALKKGGPAGVVVGGAAVVGSQIGPVIPPAVEKPVTVYRTTNLQTGETKYISISEELETKAIEQAKQKNILVEPINGLKNISKTEATNAEKHLTNLKSLPENHPERATLLQTLAKTNPQHIEFIQKELKNTITLNDNSLSVSIDKLLEAGKAPDKGGYSKAGRSLTKKSYRENSIFPRPSGSIEQINNQGEKVLEEILNHPEKIITHEVRPRFGEVIEVTIPENGGARFSISEEFICFIEP